MKEKISEKSSWEIPFETIYPKLDKDVNADVVIIGGGLAGIFNAYILAKKGVKVVLLEKEKNILSSTTMYTTAFITYVIDTDYVDLLSMLGEKDAKLSYKAGQDAIRLIESIVKEEKIECEWRRVPMYTYATDEKEFEGLKEEYESIKEAGFNVSLGKTSEKLGFSNYGYIEYSDQAKFHPIKFAKALAEKAEEHGAKIFTNSKVVEIEGLNAKTKEGSVRGKNIIIATYRPITHKSTHFKKGMYVSYVFELEARKNLIKEGLYEDMHNPYHYVRVDPKEDYDRIIVGGEDHRKEIKMDPEKNFKALEKYVKTILPKDSYKITRRWRGPVLEPSDGLPLIGEIDNNVYVASAFSGTGMTYSAISANIISDLILGESNKYAHLYNPKRIPNIKKLAIKGRDYTGELAGGALKNAFIKK